MALLLSILARVLFLLLGYRSHCFCVQAFSLIRMEPYQRLKARGRFIFARSHGSDASVLNERAESDGGSPTNQNVTQNARAKAEEWRNRARELMAEVKAIEAATAEKRITKSVRKKTGQDSLIDDLFARNVTTLILAERLRTERWSPENLMLIVERIHERQVQAMGQASATSNTGFQIGDTRNSAESNSEEYDRLDKFVNMLMDASSLLDEEHRKGGDLNTRWTGRVQISLYSRLMELRRENEQAFQNRLSRLTNSNEFVRGDSKASIQDFTRKSLGLRDDLQRPNINTSSILEMVEAIPKWLPRSIIPLYAGKKGLLDYSDIKTIEKEVLAGTEFYCTETDSVPYAAIFRGNIRSRNGGIVTDINEDQTARIYKEITEKLSNVGLSSRIQLLLLNDPEWSPNNRNEPSPKPVIIALSKAILETLSAPRQLRLATFSNFFSLLLSFSYAVSSYAMNQNFFESIQNDLTKSLASCVPLFAGLIGIQAIHEVTHRIFAARSGTKIGLPVLLPSTLLGTFGSITPLHSFPRDRTALFDFSLSGPFAGMLASVASMIGGLAATIYASNEALSRFPVTPAIIFKSSFLTGSLISFVAPKVMLLPFSQPVPMHPLFFIGFAGLISNALNVLPIGRLDGGRAYSAVFGSRSAAQASAATLSFMLLLGSIGESSISLVWAAMTVLFQRNAEIPVQNELPEVDDVRVGLYLGVLAFALLALAPFPGGRGPL